MKWLLLTIFLLMGMLLCVNSVAYADDPPDDDPEMKVDIGVSGEVEVDIGVSGPAELNVGVEGPSQVHIDAGDEVELNVDASDESEVFIDDEKANDEAGEESINAEASDVSQAVVNDAGDEPTSRSDNRLPIISGGLLALGFPILFLVRRKAKNKGGD